MLPVEQVFLLVRLQSGTWNVHVTAVTESVPRADLLEISDWFSVSKNELALRCDPLNIFFHPLPSSHYALGIIYPARRNFLAFLRTPRTFYVRILIIPPKTFLEKKKHPMALFEEFWHQHQLPLVSHPPQQLVPLVPATVTPLMNQTLLKSLKENPGAMALAQLIQSLFNAECTLFSSASIIPPVILSALFDLLPIRFRPELTFSSNFFFSPKISFRLSGFDFLRPRAIQTLKQWGIPILSLEKGDKGSMETLDPWARFVYQLLETMNFDFLEQYWKIEYQTELQSPIDSQPIIWSNLHELGVSLIQAMQSNSLPYKYVSATDISNHKLEELRCVAMVDQTIPMMTHSERGGIKPMCHLRLSDRFPQCCNELAELEVYLTRWIFGDESVLPDIKKVWSLLTPKLDAEVKETMQEEIIASIHAILMSLNENGEQRLLRNAQLLELMMFFLQKQNDET